MTAKTISILIFLLSFFLALPGESLPLKNPNIILITVDCLRFDHMGIYGYQRSTTPNIDVFFKDAARFTQAVSQSSWTSPGILSILTSLYPSVHGMDAKGKVFDKNFLTPLKQLRDEGYVTLGYDTTQNYADPGWTLESEKIPPTETLKKHRNDKFFAWFHFREPHLPYAPPEPFKSVFFKEPYSISKEKLQHVMESRIALKGKIQFDAGDLPAIRDLYDAEILYQDSLLSELFEYLNSSGLADNTIVILTADHGEELLEHGFIGHASTSEEATVYDEVVRIPLLIKIPGNPVALPMTKQVQQIDIMPTLFDLMDLKPQYPSQGQSLLPLIFMQGKNPVSQAFIETSYCGWRCPKNRMQERIHAVRAETWKFVEERKPAGTTYAFYDLIQDKGETTNLYGKINTDEYLKILSEQQTENLRLAQSLALAAVNKHLSTAHGYWDEKQPGDALQEIEQILHLDEIYRNENPSFARNPGENWKSALQQARELLALINAQRGKP